MGETGTRHVSWSDFQLGSQSAGEPSTAGIRLPSLMNRPFTFRRARRLSFPTNHQPLWGQCSPVRTPGYEVAIVDEMFRRFKAIPS